MIKSGGPGMPGFAATASRSRTWTSRCWMQNTRSLRLEDDVSCTCSTKVDKREGRRGPFFHAAQIRLETRKGNILSCMHLLLRTTSSSWFQTFNSLIVSTTNSPSDRLRLRFFFHEFHVQTRTRNSA